MANAITLNQSGAASRSQDEQQVINSCSSAACVPRSSFKALLDLQEATQRKSLRERGCCRGPGNASKLMDNLSEKLDGIQHPCLFLEIMTRLLKVILV